jgi:hypothetical protein
MAHLGKNFVVQDLPTLNPEESKFKIANVVGNDHDGERFPLHDVGLANLCCHLRQSSSGDTSSLSHTWVFVAVIPFPFRHTCSVWWVSI